MEEDHEEVDYLLRAKKWHQRKPVSPAKAGYGSIQREDSALLDPELASSSSGNQQESKVLEHHLLSQSESFPVSRARVASLAVMCFYMVCGCVTQLQAQYFHTRFRPDFFNDTGVNGSSNKHAYTKCDGNNSGSDARNEAALQEYVSQFMLYLSYSSIGPMIVATLIFGCLSDVLGRRGLFILPILSAFIKVVIVVVATKLHLHLWVFFVANVVDGMSGSFCTLLLATFAYTADLTTPGKTRTFGITVANSLLIIAYVCSQLAAGYILQNYGYFYAFLMPSISLACGIIVIIFFLPETVRTRRSGCVNPLKYLKNAFGFYIFDGTCLQRATFSMSLLVLFLSWVATMSSDTVFTLYQINLPFCWSPEQVGQYGAFTNGALSLMNILMVHLLQKCLSDCSLFGLSLLSKAGQYVMVGVAQNDLMLYLAPLVGVCGAMSSSVGRGMLSKMAPSDKQGAVFASVALTETLSTLASSTLFNTVYKATLAYYRGAVFLFMAAFMGLDLCLTLVLSRLMLRNGAVRDGHAKEFVQNS